MAPTSPSSSSQQDAVTASRRRRSFHRTTPSLSTYQTTDISKHYAVNNQLLSAFESFYADEGTYQVAYAIGLQFVETALLEIPKHGYFNASRHETDRMQSALNAVRVTQALQEIQQQQQQQDDQVGIHSNNSNSSTRRLDKLQELALEQVEQASTDQTYESHRATTEREIRHGDWVVDCMSEPFLVACQDSISSILCPTRMAAASNTSSSSSSPIPSSSIPSSIGGRSVPGVVHTTNNAVLSSGAQEQRVPTIDESRSGEYIMATGVPVDFRAPPPAAAVPVGPLQRAFSSEELALEKALYLSGLEVVVPVSVVEVQDQDDTCRMPPPTSPTLQHGLKLDILSRLYYDDFEALVNSKRIRISFVETYQGRLPSSTNGCAVIAPVLCMHHLLDNIAPDPGLCDPVVKHVIDVETPVILNEVRDRLGLADQAFLIPADVHDHLIGNGQLAQEQFVTVAGGNILDDEHVEGFLASLADPKRPKLAATLFFHEHVVAILRLQRDKTTVWYDVIDSLPLQETLVERDKTKDNVLSIRSTYSGETGEATLSKTARIRCLNAEALKACLRWYACSKFSEDNMNYIDMYAWDDNECDFDPRVFQAFVWGDANGDAPTTSDTVTN